MVTMKEDISMNIGRPITGPDDLGYDPEIWEPSHPSAAAEMDDWLSKVNDQAALDGPCGVSARKILELSRSIVRRDS